MPTFTSFRFRHLYMGLALAGAFITGWVTAGTQIATEINTGLVRALNSVGQDPVWQRGFQCILPPNPIYPEPGLLTAQRIRYLIPDNQQQPGSGNAP